jgi:hypothetical protein
MKKIFLLIVLSILAASCSIPPPPNPGYRVETTVEVRQGTFPFYADIPVGVSGAVTNGQFVRVLPIQEPITGNVESFVGKVSSGVGFIYFDVPDGKTPATWIAQAISGWQIGNVNCNGKGTAFGVQAGRVVELRCEIVGTFGLPFRPSAVSNSSTFPNQIQTSVPDVSTSYGMPVIHFEDHKGTVVGVTTATAVNGVDITFNPSCIRGKPVGQYAAKIYNAVPSGTASSRPIGNSSITVTDQPCPGMDSSIQACFNSGFRWDFTNCYCTQIH